MNLSQKRVRFGKHMGLGAMIAAALFLFNPDIAVVDVLPDFIGYILLAVALRFVRDLSPHLENAWRKFRLLALVTGLKFVSLFWVFGGLSNAQERPTMLLLLSFCFCILELGWGIPAWRELIEGFILHAQTSGGEYVLREKGAKSYRTGKNISISFRDFTVFFMIAKAFLANISEFSVLSDHSYDDTAFNWYRFIGLYRTLALFVGMIIGIVWLVWAIRYFCGIIRDADFIDSAKKKYETTVLPNTGLFVRRDIAFVLLILSAAALTTPDLYLDDVNAVPDTLTAILLAWTFIRLKPYYKNYMVGVGLSAVYGVMTVWGANVSKEYVTGSWVAKTWEDPKVFGEFIAMYPIRVVEAILFFVTFFVALRGVLAIIKAHCGYIPSTMDEKYRTARLEAIHKEVGMKVTAAAVFAALTAVTGGLYELMLSLDNFVSEIWWLINFAVSLGFFATVIYMMHAVNEEVESRYMLD